jgi:hypothetical protein
MTIKHVVAFAIYIAIFLIVSIFLIAFLKTPVFLYIYFIFALFFLIAIGASLKKAYPDRINFSFLLVMIILVAVSLTFFGNSVKGYYDKNTAIGNSNQDLNAQIDNITRTNNYYLSYISFINDEILKTRQATNDLQAQLDKIIAQQNVPAQTPVNNAPIIIREREDDD